MHTPQPLVPRKIQERLHAAWCHPRGTLPATRALVCQTLTPPTVILSRVEFNSDHADSWLQGAPPQRLGSDLGSFGFGPSFLPFPCTQTTPQGALVPRDRSAPHTPSHSKATPAQLWWLWHHLCTHAGLRGAGQGTGPLENSFAPQDRHRWASGRARSSSALPCGQGRTQTSLALGDRGGLQGLKSQSTTEG